MFARCADIKTAAKRGERHEARGRSVMSGTSSTTVVLSRKVTKRPRVPASVSAAALMETSGFRFRENRFARLVGVPVAQHAPPLPRAALFVRCTRQSFFLSKYASCGVTSVQRVVGQYI